MYTLKSICFSEKEWYLYIINFMYFNYFSNEFSHTLFIKTKTIKSLIKTKITVKYEVIR